VLTLILLGRYLVHNNYCNRQLEDLDFGNKQCLFPLLSTKKSSLLKDISRNTFGKDMMQIFFFSILCSLFRTPISISLQFAYHELSYISISKCLLSATQLLNIF
jgi:hypothetical protein